jgi:DNA-binding NarL/FixJ family response regulator
MDSIRVLIADDHPLVRAGIRALLQGLAGVEVLDEAGDGREALRLVKLHRPDILLADIGMPHMNGLELAGQVSLELPATRIIVVSMHTSEEYVNRALQLGVKGYVLKDADAAELEVAVKAVARGETYLSPSISKRIISEYLKRTGMGSIKAGPLTPRQSEILVLVAEGQTTKGIARRLGISVKTVEAHRAQLMDRLCIHEVAGLVRYAIRIGLVQQDD